MTTCHNLPQQSEKDYNHVIKTPHCREKGEKGEEEKETEDEEKVQKHAETIDKAHKGIQLDTRSLFNRWAKMQKVMGEKHDLV